MDKNQWLAEKFEENRGRMRAVAYRMLGSLNEADDAVQEAWIRLSRSGEDNIKNLGGWLTTVVSRVCLDMLRSRKSRGEVPIEEQVSGPVAVGGPVSDPEQEALLADSVGLALLVVLGRLTPAERVAFVLHDMFAVPFEEIAPIVGRTPSAARPLASRARRRVRGVRPRRRAAILPNNSKWPTPSLPRCGSAISKGSSLCLILTWWSMWTKPPHGLGSQRNTRRAKLAREQSLSPHWPGLSSRRW